MTRRFVLSGAITGHEAEAAVYFAEAERIVKENYPCAEVFNPARLPSTMGWEAAMAVCRMRIKGWATDFVVIQNKYRAASRGSAEEDILANAANLTRHVIENSVMREVVPCRQ